VGESGPGSQAPLAGEALWEEVRAVAYRTLRARGYAHADADDAAQDTVLELEEALAKGEVLRNPAGWAAVVAGRRAVDNDRAARVRRGQRARADEGEDEAEGTQERDGTGRDTSEGEDRGPRRSVAASDALSRFLVSGVPTSYAGVQREQLARLAEALDERQLQVAWLIVEGLSQAEIAEVVGASQAAIKRDMTRMRAKLRQRADELGIALKVLEHPRAY
jgi:RNA polymerase sigma factor (sigma-70 family)